VKQWADAHQAVPGADYYQEPDAKTYDYLAARGYIDIAAVKNYFNVTVWLRSPFHRRWISQLISLRFFCAFDISRFKI
jgi:hypothetical protein